MAYIKIEILESYSEGDKKEKVLEELKNGFIPIYALTPNALNNIEITN